MPAITAGCFITKVLWFILISYRLTCFVGECTCGSFGPLSIEVNQLVVESSLSKRYDLIPSTGYPTTPRIDVCASYQQLCESWMDYTFCPKSERETISCINFSNYSSWMGVCRCKSYDASPSILTTLLNSVARPNAYPLLTVNLTSSADIVIVDFCSSFSRICSFIQHKLACPLSSTIERACQGDDISSFVGVCSCGNLTEAFTSYIGNVVIDASLQEHVDASYLLKNPARTPLTQLVNSNPFLQIIDPLQVG